MPADGPSLGIVSTVEPGIDAQALGPAADVAQRRLPRLLHHFAQLPRQHQLAAPRHQRGFDGQDLAAELGPGQTGRHADLGLAHGVGGQVVARHAE
jgi:hypothetical protein